MLPHVPGHCHMAVTGMQAHEHADELYRACPKWCIHWEQRGPGIMAEILHWAPDIGCLQEVDHPDEFDAFLQQHGCAVPDPSQHSSSLSLLASLAMDPSGCLLAQSRDGFYHNGSV